MQHGDASRASGVVPPAISTTIVRRETYPRVPPELLLREHSAKFRLTGLTLASLLETIRPSVPPTLPPFVLRNNSTSGSRDALIDNLLRTLARRPPVPRENIRQLNPGALRLEREAREEREARQARRNPGSTTQSAEGAQTNGPTEETVGGALDQAAPSRLTTVEMFPHLHQRGMEGKKGGENSSALEWEALWGYDTGAVVHVRLQTFAADMDLRTRRREVRASRVLRATQFAHRKPSQSSPHSAAASSSSTSSSSHPSSPHAPNWREEPTPSPRAQQRPEKRGSVLTAEEEEDAEFGLDPLGATSRAPRGVSLLGYHSTGSVQSVAYDARTGLALSGGADGTLLSWDVHQQYRSILRERHGREEDMRHTRVTQQFAAHVRSRRLAQRLPRAHDGAINAIATHCELLLTGGVDGVVRVWVCDSALTTTNTTATAMITGGPPQYVERQMFRCRGWVRHIWCASGRNVQGEDVLVADDAGAITAFKGCTLSQPPPPGEYDPTTPTTTLLARLGTTPRATVAVKASLSLTANEAPFVAPLPQTETLMDAIRRSTGRPLLHRNGNGSESKSSVMGLLRRGVVRRALRATRVQFVMAPESRILGDRAGRTDSVTRLVPLVERNVLVVIGYSPVVRLLDLSRFGLLATVEHPATGASNVNQPKSSLNAYESGVYAGGEPLRFIDVLHISSPECLLLLDNYDTILVWDSASNTVLTTWRPPPPTSGRRDVALRLLHGSLPTTGGRAEEAAQDAMAGITRIPFFVLRGNGMELCEVVIAAHARTELRGHEDTVIGIAPRGKITQRSIYVSNDSVSEKKSLIHCTESDAAIRSITTDADREGDADSDAVRFISCAADGALRFWSSEFHLLRECHPNHLPSDNADFCTTVTHPPYSTRVGSYPTPFDPTQRGRERAMRVENPSQNDATSFLLIPAWSMAVTGHDDGSVRYWPCDQQLSSCTWHKGLHRNTISGLCEGQLPREKGDEMDRRRRQILRGCGTAAEMAAAAAPLELLATVSFDGYLALWTGVEQGKASLHARTRASQNELLCVAFEAINSLFVVGDNSGVVSSWRAMDLEPQRAIPSRPPSPWQPSFDFPSLPPLQPTQRREEGTGKRRVGHTEAVTSLVVDGHFVFSGGEDGRVLLWDLHIGALLREYFPLHDHETIVQHKCRFETASANNMYHISSTTFMLSSECNPRSTVPTAFAEPFRPPPPEDVACIVLLKHRDGDLIVGTREGWMYHFTQRDSYPCAAYKHTSPVRTLCVLNEGFRAADVDFGVSTRAARTESQVDDFAEALDNGVFEIGVGGEDGTIAIVLETYFTSMAHSQHEKGKKPR